MLRQELDLTFDVAQEQRPVFLAVLYRQVLLDVVHRSAEGPGLEEPIAVSDRGSSRFQGQAVLVLEGPLDRPQDVPRSYG